jgi:hypothetical protein
VTPPNKEVTMLDRKEAMTQPCSRRSGAGSTTKHTTAPKQGKEAPATGEVCQATEQRYDPALGGFGPLEQCPEPADDLGPDGHAYCRWHLSLLNEGPAMEFRVYPDRVEGPFEGPDTETDLAL